MKWPRIAALIGLVACGSGRVHGQSRVETPTYQRIRAAIDAIPAIDTHDHLWPFDRLPGLMETDKGRGMTLYGLWRASYFPQIHPPTPRRPGEPFATWWERARHDFDDARATGFYRYQLPAFRDLYGVDFDRITDEQAAALDARIFANYRDTRWIHHVVTERARIELMLNDPYWGRFDFTTHYPFEVLVFNVTTLVDGFHPSEFKQPADDPYRFARDQHLKVESLDDYLSVLDRLFRVAREKGAVCLKTTKAYERTLRFEDVPSERRRPDLRPPPNRVDAAGGEGLPGLHHVAAGRARAPGMIYRSRSTPATASSRGRTRCSWSTSSRPTRGRDSSCSTADTRGWERPARSCCGMGRTSGSIRSGCRRSARRWRGGPCTSGSR